MQVACLLPAKFDSNIYVARQLASEKLDALIHFRLNPNLYQNHINDIQVCDKLLISEHYNFIKLVQMVELTEMSSFRYGSDMSDTMFFSL